MPTERTVEHPDGRVERITENSGPTVVERRGSGMGAAAARQVHADGGSDEGR